eukprot:scaffold792_cov84-Cylindrotheca_fusiformis.AAC.1
MQQLLFLLLFVCQSYLPLAADATSKCFGDSSDEIAKAVKQYIQDGCSDKKNCNNSVVEAYGWPIGTWCVSNVTSMSELFADPDFNDDISGWDVSSVTDMSRMFYGAWSFNGDLSNWDVSSVTDMGQMFMYAYSFNGDLSNWDVSSVTDMSGMFEEAWSFNGDLSNWDVSSVTSMGRMFMYAASFNGDLSNWDVSSVRDVTDKYDMFSDAQSFDRDVCCWGEKWRKIFACSSSELNCLTTPTAIKP